MKSTIPSFLDTAEISLAKELLFESASDVCSGRFIEMFRGRIKTGSRRYVVARRLPGGEHNALSKCNKYRRQASMVMMMTARRPMCPCSLRRASTKRLCSVDHVVLRHRRIAASSAHTRCRTSNDRERRPS